MSIECISPVDIKELRRALKNAGRRPFRFIAGGTDVLIELKRNSTAALLLVNISGLRDPEFRRISKQKGCLSIGAGVTAAALTKDPFIREAFPVLHAAAFQLASTQIRNVATVGGNICTASPSGDIACALMALESVCELVDMNGKRRQVPLEEFFRGPRRTILKKGELLWRLTIPAPRKGCKRIYSGFVKVGTRRAMECSVVSLAYHFQEGADQTILHAGAAIGAAAPVIRFISTACDSLLGKDKTRLKEKDISVFAEEVLRYADPISDLRASAWYRKESLFNVSKGILEDIQGHEH